MAVFDSDHLTRDDLRALVQERHQQCVSLYLGRAQVGQETTSDGIRLKNLAKQAVEELMQRGLRRPQAETIVAPALDLLSSPLRWQGDGDGLALFMSEEAARRYMLPHSFEDLVIANDRFHIEQLLPLVNDEQHFYILALQRRFVRLYEATPHSIRQIALPDMPGSIDEVTKYDVYQDMNRNWHSSSGVHPARRQQAPTFNGQKDTKAAVKRETQDFFRGIDGALIEALKLEKAPLVIACIAEEIPEYRAVNSYPYLMEDAIATGPELLSDDELHKRAWEIVRPQIERSQHEALDRFREYSATGRVSRDLSEIVPAAVFGRVESLFVPSGTHVWGAYDPATGEVRAQHDERQPGDEDLIDVAAMHALATRGEVFALPTERMPEQAVAAAVFRY